MRTSPLLLIPLLTPSALSKPFLRRVLHFPRQFTNTTSEMTQTSTDNNLAATSTLSSPACIATYTATEDEKCSEVASQYNIQLSTYEANTPADSIDCQDLLLGYRVCLASNATTSSAAEVTPSPTLAASNGTFAANGTAPSNATITSAPLANNATAANVTIPAGNTTYTVGPPLERVILTHTTVTTLTYTIGTGTSKAQRTTKVTHTSTEEMDVTSSEPASTAEVSVVNGVLATPDATPTSSSVPETTSSSASTSETKSTGSVAANALAAASTTGQSPETLSTCATAAPPANTQASAITGCTRWHVAKAGEYCFDVADEYNLTVGNFMAMNPAVGAPICPNLLTGDAYCVATCDGTIPTATAVLLNSLSSTQSSRSIGTPMAALTTLTMSVTMTSSLETLETLTTLSTLTRPLTSVVAAGTSAAAPSASATKGADVYKTYKGNGSVADGWPAQDQWVDFDDMFEANRKLINPSCDAWGVPRNSDAETEEMKNAITEVANSTGVDSRFILATIMQESTGCVRVITTEYSHFNPGLMQSHNGTGTCNTNLEPLGIAGTTAVSSNVQTPCASSEIHQQVQDGAGGTSSGDGLKQILAAQVTAGFDNVSRFYRAARVYNGGSVDPSGDLEKGCCTRCYASDVANRLTGWVSAPHTCDL